jgi:predicted transcriptional regulator
MADATPWESLSLEDLLKLVKKYGSRNKAAESLGVAKSTFKDHMKKLEQASLTHRAVVKPVKIAKPRSGVKRFILTSAQDSTEVNKEFLNNLLAYADWLGNCQVMISGFTYNKSLFEDHDKKGQSVYFDSAVEPYLTNDRTVIGDGVVFCGEYNRLPTTANPLAGYGAYTRDKWASSPMRRYTWSLSRA